MRRIVDRAGATQTGNVRRLNEDSYLIREPLFMVADGMGGAQAGEIASRMTTEEFAQVELIPAARRGHAARGDRGRQRQVNLARRAVTPTSPGWARPWPRRWSDDDGQIAFAYVGDSRAYLLRDGSLQRLTEDHSLVGELVRQGELTEAEAEQPSAAKRDHPGAGAGPEVACGHLHDRSQPGDVVLLCSDGLTTMVDEQTIGRLLHEHAEPTPQPVSWCGRRWRRAARTTSPW